MKKPNNKQDNSFIIFSIAILIFCCIAAASLFLYSQSGTITETRIIKVKYETGNGLVDNCGHPSEYLMNRLIHINKSDVYEATFTSKRNSYEYITNITLVDKEKYIENCSLFI